METVITYRRALHRIPELGYELPQTLAFVKTHLAALDCTVALPSRSAITAFFDAGAKTALAFRADMDALPIEEKTSASYASCHAGQMHACGHDGHTAMLLAFADWLSAHKTELKSNVLLIFQPAEEATGGAQSVCATGLLAAHNVRAAFGLHLWPGLPAGQLATRPGPLMARSCEVNVTVTGKSVHIAKAAEGADAAEAAAALLLEAYRMERTELPADCLRLLKFGELHAGTVRNALAATAVLRGSLRAFYDADFEFLQRRLRELSETVPAQFGCTGSLHCTEGIPAVHNDETLTEQLFAMRPEMLRLTEPSMTAEDFSFYGKEVPAVFSFLGTGRSEPLHGDHFDFEESTLLAGVEFYKSLLAL